MWKSYKRFSKEHWNGMINAAFKIGIIRSCIGGLYHFMAWYIGSIFYLMYGVAWLSVMCTYWAMTCIMLGVIALFRLILGKSAEKQSSSVKNMDGWQYEQYVAGKLQSEGFHSVQVTRGSGDYGADIIAYDKKGRKYCIQCKLYSSAVGVKAVQEVIAAREYYGGNVAMVITNSSFTNAALEMARRTSVILRSNYM